MLSYLGVFWYGVTVPLMNMDASTVHHSLSGVTLVPGSGTECSLTEYFMGSNQVFWAPTQTLYFVMKKTNCRSAMKRCVSYSSLPQHVSSPWSCLWRALVIISISHKQSPVVVLKCTWYQTMHKALWRALWGAWGKGKCGACISSTAK